MVRFPIKNSFSMRSGEVLLLIVFFFLFMIPFISFADNNEEYSRLEYQYNDYIIMPETLVYKIKKNIHDYILYDLRDFKAYSEYHVVGAKSLPWDQMKKSLSLSNFPKNKQIILISSDGFYSLKALELLLNNGYVSVYSIEGGMDNWPYKKLLVEKNP